MFWFEKGLRNHRVFKYPEEDNTIPSSGYIVAGFGISKSWQTTGCEERGTCLYR